MEYKKDIEAADRDAVKQDHQIIGEVVVETSDNNGQAVDEPHNQVVVAANQHQQPVVRHPPTTAAPPPPPPAPTQQQQQQLPPPQQQHHAKGMAVVAPSTRQQQQQHLQHLQLHHQPEHTPASRPQPQQWVSKDEGEERVGIASAAGAVAQPITVITAPKTRMINSSGNIRYVSMERAVRL